VTAASPDAVDVSVVIVNWNAREHVLACLASLALRPPAGPWDAVVVDNASHDGSVDAIRAAHPWVRVIANDTNRGLAAANNQGIAATSGRYVLISNPDVVYGDGAIDALVSLLERRAGAAFAVSRLLHADGTPQPGAGDLPTLREALLGRWLGRGGATDGFWWTGWAHDTERRIGHGGEACYLVRRAAIEAMGDQDERFPLDWEGIEWSRRAARTGWEVWFCPDAEVVHAGGVSVRQVPGRWVVRSHLGMYRYFRDEVGRIGRPLLLAAIAGRAAVKLGSLVLSGSRLYDRGHRKVATGARRP
jgi:GT2 family glycosyltransferase